MNQYIHEELYLTVSVDCRTEFGQNVKIIGNCPQLGDWKITKALPLFTNKGSYPIWSTEKLYINKENFEFKFIKVDDKNNVVWESFPENRKYKAEQNYWTQLLCTFNSLDTAVKCRSQFAPDTDLGEMLCETIKIRQNGINCQISLSSYKQLLEEIKKKDFHFRQIKQKLICKICQNQDACYLASPCNHVVSCEKCLLQTLKNNRTCPVCRKQNIVYSQIYF